MRIVCASQARQGTVISWRRAGPLFVSFVPRPSNRQLFTLHNNHYVDLTGKSRHVTLPTYLDCLFLFARLMSLSREIKGFASALASPSHSPYFTVLRILQRTDYVHVLLTESDGPTATTHCDRNLELPCSQRIIQEEKDPAGLLTLRIKRVGDPGPLPQGRIRCKKECYPCSQAENGQNLVGWLEDKGQQGEYKGNRKGKKEWKQLAETFDTSGVLLPDSLYCICTRTSFCTNTCMYVYLYSIRALSATMVFRNSLVLRGECLCLPGGGTSTSFFASPFFGE